VDVVKLLLEHGADINTNRTIRVEAYSAAASRGFTSIMLILVEYGVNTKNNVGTGIVV
jgi:ankyrin repeat protein